MICEVQKKIIIKFVNVTHAVEALSTKHLLHIIGKSFVVVLNDTNIDRKPKSVDTRTKLDVYLMSCDTKEVISRSSVHSVY